MKLYQAVYVLTTEDPEIMPGGILSHDIGI